VRSGTAATGFHAAVTAKAYPSGPRSAISLAVILVTGGAGFVGSNLAVALSRRQPNWEVVALDSLHRKGSELNLPRLTEAGVRFVRGDVREPDALDAVGPITALVECSAEPSVMSAIEGGTSFVYHTNLTGAYNCLELARRRDAYLVFLSTSRVYPVASLNELDYEEGETRFELSDRQRLPGASAAGISEEFPIPGARTLYGTTKLAAELLIEEYRAMFGLGAVINRCGVIAGPWQMGKVDQGVFTHWMLSHHFGLPLTYIGYGGKGKQVRDLLHVDDLVDLIELQLLEPDRWDGMTFNVGGGRACSLSLYEATLACQRITGNEVPVRPVLEPRPGDVPVYLSDCASLFEHTRWRPRRDADRILRGIYEWLVSDDQRIGRALGIR
jgi:CDP-paratose 2-epimerase